MLFRSTKGATLTSDITADEKFDAARANLGSQWRMPTTTEFQELFNNCIYIDASGAEISAGTVDKRVTINGIKGLYLQSKTNGNRLFFACSGRGYGTSWGSWGSNGYYWSASFRSASNAKFLLFYGGGVYPQDSGNVPPQSQDCRYAGFPVRPVQ